MTKYEKIDAAVLASLSADKPKDFTPLFSGNVRLESDKLAALEVAKSFRILGRRLQAMRKGGRIRYKRGSKAGWILIEAVAP